MQRVFNDDPATDAGRDVVPNVPGLFGSIALGQIRQTWRTGERVSPGYSSFARRAEKKWDAEDSVPPGRDSCRHRR
jgi:hypothetical protein